MEKKENKYGGFLAILLAGILVFGTAGFYMNARQEQNVFHAVRDAAIAFQQARYSAE